MNRFLSYSPVAISLAVIFAPLSAYSFAIAPGGTEGLQVVVDSTDPVTATYQGHSASFSNDLYLMLDASGNPGDDGNFLNDLFIFNNKNSPVGSKLKLGSFDIGTELMFRLYVNNTSYNYFNGAASQNPDNKAHARVQSNWQPNETLVSFEDLLNTPEAPGGYNDLSFSLTNTVAQPVPEPLTMFGSIVSLVFGAGLKRKLSRQKLK